MCSFCRGISRSWVRKVPVGRFVVPEWIIVHRARVFSHAWLELGNARKVQSVRAEHVFLFRSFPEANHKGITRLAQGQINLLDWKEKDTISSISSELLECVIIQSRRICKTCLSIYVEDCDNPSSFHWTYRRVWNSRQTMETYIPTSDDCNWLQATPHYMNSNPICVVYQRRCRYPRTTILSLH